MKKDDVTFRSTEEGLVIGINGKQNYSDLKATLKKQFAGSGQMFTGDSRIIIDIGTNSLSIKEKKEITRMVKKYSGGDLQEISWRQARPIGQVISLEAREEINLQKQKENKTNISTKEDETAIPWEQDATPETLTEEPFGLANHADEVGEEDTLLIKRTLRSGQSVHFDGNVVVLGDVNPGAEIVAGGNIIVMGSFRGVAHAGAAGNESAIVTAFRLQPTQLRIANHITRSPDGEFLTPNQPEVARIKDGVVMIEAYQTNQEKQMKIG